MTIQFANVTDGMFQKFIWDLEFDLLAIEAENWLEYDLDEAIPQYWCPIHICILPQYQPPRMPR